jgi:pyridoxamine 5'-phosphate oxidase-like protein
MATVYDEIDDQLSRWLLAQPVFFVGTAPRSDDGHVNVSPKGMGGTFVVLGPHQVAYLDYFGSGIETVAHVQENGRIVIMCCAFTGPPKIVRLHGRGRFVRPGDPEFARLRPQFSKERDRGLRAIVVVDVDRIADSCGYSVPLMDYVGDRDVLDRAQERRDDEYYDSYAITHNAQSIDGLPGLAPAEVPAQSRARR